MGSVLFTVINAYCNKCDTDSDTVINTLAFIGTHFFFSKVTDHGQKVTQFVAGKA